MGRIKSTAIVLILLLLAVFFYRGFFAVTGVQMYEANKVKECSFVCAAGYESCSLYRSPSQFTCTQAGGAATTLAANCVESATCSYSTGTNYCVNCLGYGVPRPTQVVNLNDLAANLFSSIWDFIANLLGWETGGTTTTTTTTVLASTTTTTTAAPAYPVLVHNVTAYATSLQCCVYDYECPCILYGTCRRYFYSLTSDGSAIGTVHADEYITCGTTKCSTYSSSSTRWRICEGWGFQ